MESHSRVEYCIGEYFGKKEKLKLQKMKLMEILEILDFNCIFIQFDIEEFYPSITKQLLLKAIEHAKLYTSIIQREFDIILHARKSLLFSKNKPWEKQLINDYLT